MAQAIYSNGASLKSIYRCASFSIIADRHPYVIPAEAGIQS
jgi:hypothetical protein